jgi:hypothetical protein
MELNVTKYGTTGLTTLTEMLMLKQPLSDMLTMVQGMEGHLLREN